MARLFTRAFAGRPELRLLVRNAGVFFNVAFRKLTLTLCRRNNDLNVKANSFAAQAFTCEMTDSLVMGQIGRL